MKKITIVLVAILLLACGAIAAAPTESPPEINFALNSTAEGPFVAMAGIEAISDQNVVVYAVHRLPTLSQTTDVVLAGTLPSNGSEFVPSSRLRTDGADRTVIARISSQRCGQTHLTRAYERGLLTGDSRGCAPLSA